MAQGLPRYGVIRWIGSLSGLKDKLAAGLELVRAVTSIFSKATWTDCKSHLSLQTCQVVCFDFYY